MYTGQSMSGCLIADLDMVVEWHGGIRCDGGRQYKAKEASAFARSAVDVKCSTVDVETSLHWWSRS